MRVERCPAHSCAPTWTAIPRKKNGRSVFTLQPSFVMRCPAELARSADHLPPASFFTLSNCSAVYMRPIRRFCTVSVMASNSFMESPVHSFAV